MKKKIISLFVLIYSILFLFILTSCSSSKNTIYFANFESYMSSDLKNDLRNQLKEKNVNIQYRYYGTNEILERSFERNYDVAIPSAYLVKKFADNGKIKKINWEKFNLKKSNGSEIKNGQDALELFSPDVAKIINDVYKFSDPKINLLDYGIPYFVQDLVIGYKKKNNFQFTGEFTWENVRDEFSNKINNNFFNKIAMINDYRSIYSIPSIIKTINDKPNVNPDSKELENIISIKTFEDTYNEFFKKFTKKNSFLLNSDSGFVLNDFVSPKGSDVSIMYNGDLLYASLGGDEYSSEKENESDINNPFFTRDTNDLSMNFIRPKQTLIALDMVVINKNVDEWKENILYESVLKKVGLEGSDIKSTNDLGETIITYEQLKDCGPYINFENILYTSPLKNIYEFVTNGGFFNDFLSSLGYGVDFITKNIDFFKSIFKTTTPDPTNMIEKDLSDMNKSNMYYAFVNVKENL